MGERTPTPDHEAQAERAREYSEKISRYILNILKCPNPGTYDADDEPIEGKNG